MAKLFFRYSAMDAGKTLDLLKVAYNYSDRGQQPLILTSSIDNRAGINQVKSRIGLTKEAISIDQDHDLYQLIAKHHDQSKLACVLVDEIQFFSVEQIEHLSAVVDELNIPVICYGLRSDYRGQAFPAAAHLLAISDSIEELKTICHCGRKATHNMLVKNGVAIKHGNAVVIDNEDLKKDGHYVSVCRKHWKSGTWN